MKKIILAITLVVLLGSCEGTVQNPQSVSTDSVKTVEKSENTIKILNNKTADDFCQVMEEVDGHKFLLVIGYGIHSAPSVTHLPSCWCFKDSVK